MITCMGYLTGEPKYLDKAEEMYHAFFDALDGYESTSAFFLQSLLLTENPTKEVVVLGAEGNSEKGKLLATLSERFLANVTTLVAEKPEQFSKSAPYAAEYKQMDQATTVYVCENFSCQQPTTDMGKAVRMIIDE